MISILLKYFPNLTETQRKQFEALKPLYTDWNEQINVISRKDIEMLYERHILHSLSIAKIMEFAPETQILDVGCGGGFPGIPLAILFPECKFHLVDSIGKKIKVVTEIAAAIKLTNLTAEHTRAEDVVGKYQFVVTRAVAKATTVHAWVQHKFGGKQFNKLPNGIFFLKGGDLTEEFKKYKRRTDFYELKDLFEEEFFETKQVVYVQM